MVKMYFANVTKLRIWKWGNFPGLSEDAQYNRRVLIRGRQENQRGVGDRTTEARDVSGAGTGQ